MDKIILSGESAYCKCLFWLAFWLESNGFRFIKHFSVKHSVFQKQSTHSPLTFTQILNF